MESAKPLKFTGTAGGFFMAYLVYVVASLVPIVGMVIGFNYFAKWVATSLEVNGKKVAYKATLGEAFVPVFVGTVLTVITFGIYMFWFIPKLYRFAAEHTVYDDGSTVAAKPVEAAPAAPAADAAPSTPAATPETPPSTPETPAATPPATPGAPSGTPPQGPVVG